MLLALLGAASAHGASTGTQMLRVTGGDGLRANGDYVSAGTGTDDQYRFLVEVPPGTTTLTIDVFDADFGISAADEAADLDRQRGGFNSTVEYRVFNPSAAGQVERFNFGDNTSAVGATPTGIRDTAGTGISCNATGPTVSAHANWCTLFTVANPAAGHWLVEIDTSQLGGDDVNAFGIRAHDGNTGGGAGGGVELNIYAESAVQIGVNQLDGAATRSAVFTLHPYAIRGCTTDVNDFDYDSASALVVGSQQQTTVDNRPATASTTFLNATLSDNDAWANHPVTTGSGSTSQRDGMGIWTLTSRINEAASDNANYATLYLGDDVAATPAAGATPANNPDPDTFRIYLPSDAGVAPVKPYLWQQLFYASGTTPPLIGSTTTYTVNVRIVNPTAFPITIDGTSGQSILARIPTDAGANDVNFVAGSLAATQGTPTIAGNRNITWNPGTIAAGAEQLMTYRVTVLPETATVNVTGAGNATAFGNTLGTRADFYDETGILTSGGAADIAFGGLCPLQVVAAQPVPTAATLTWMKAARAGSALDVAWTTDSEYSSFGFDLYGRRNGAWVKLNARIVPSHHDTAEPQDYTLRIDGAADVDAVALEELGATGTRKRFATLAVGAELGKRISAAKIDWASARSELDATMAMRTLAALDGPSGSTAPRAYLDVDADGLWRVSVAQLASAGLDFSGVAVSELALTNNNVAVPVRIRNAAGATLGASAVIEFHGRARDSLYGKRNAYLLAADAANARRVRETLGAAQPWPQALTAYPHEVVRRNDAAYSFGSRGDPWYDTFQFAQFPNAGERDYVVSVDAIASGEGASVLVDVAGAADWPDVGLDQVLEVLVNGTSLGTSEFPGRERALLRFPLPPATLIPGNNTITLRQPVSHLGAGQYAGIFVERLELQYTRSFTALGGKLSAQLGTRGDNEATSDLLFRDGVGDVPGACARGECVAIDTTGWTSATLNAWVVGSAEHLVLADATPSGGSLRVLAPTGQFHKLVVSDEAGVRTPAVRVAPAVGEPALPGAAFLIVSHPAFADGLADFVAARSAEMTVRVVDTEQVYTRYSSGQADPSAIRALLRDAYAQGTRYALLVGGDTYDYDNHSGTGAISYVPTIYTSTGEVVNYAPADSLYGDVDGDGAADIAVGRWPVRNAQQLAAVVQKTLAYASADHAGEALFVASQPETGLDFSALSASLRAPLDAQGWTTQVVGAAGGASPDPAQATVLAALNEGRALTNFVGHSSVIRWQANSDFNSTLLEGATAESSLANATNPTIVAHWGCLAGWFVSTSYNSMSQNFLLDLNGGAAAAIGAATLVDTPQQDEFIRIFLERAGTGTVRLGDALDQTRREFASTFGTRRDLVYGVNLLGDPTLRIRR